MVCSSCLPCHQIQNPSCTWFNPPPACPAGNSGSQSPLSPPALTSSLNGYNRPISAFMHTICPGPGQGVTSIRPAAPLQPAQIGEIINTMARVRFLFVGVNPIRSRWLETGIAGRSQVCLFYQLFIAAEQASNWRFSVCGQGKLEHGHILVKRDWDRENESLVRIDFSVLENKLEPHTHTTTGLQPCTYWSTLPIT